MNLFLMCFTAGECFLLSFLLFFHPLKENLYANRWLALFLFMMGTAFIGVYFSKTTAGNHHPYVFQCINSLQFIMAPSLYLSTLYFADPVKVFKKKDILHFIPFLLYVFIQAPLVARGSDFMNQRLFDIGNTSILIRDLLPLQLLIYILLSYRTLVNHQQNLQRITASFKGINLNWLRYFLLILTLITFFWINDALLGLSFLLQITPLIYTGSIFFLAYFSIRQRTVFAFNQQELQEISVLLERPQQTDLQKTERLSAVELDVYAQKLHKLMTRDRLFLDNNLSLPMLADQLGCSIHDASFLINKLSDGNFYTFINQQRVEEAKKLLHSGKKSELNMLGIAFASGFNSKTAFNTAFKKYCGMSPTTYAKRYGST
eukprot:gene17808-21239_t